MNTQNYKHFDASAFSSRKLLEMAEQAARERIQEHRSAAVDELARRGHYLTELADRGLISTTTAA